MADSVNIPLALIKDARLSLSDFRVYAALSVLADENHTCTSSRQEIQNTIGVQHVSRSTHALSQYGYIQIEKTGYGNNNAYKLLTGNEKSQRQHGTLEEFQKEYLEYSSGLHTPKTTRTHRTAFNEFIRIEGNRPIDSIGVREIEHFLSLKKREASEWTGRKYYGSLAASFEKAVQWGLIKTNPFRKVKKPKPPEVSPVFFKDNEFRMLLSAIPSRDFRELCTTALLSGMRLGELLSLRWENIDFATKVIQVKNCLTFTTKSKKNRNVPMCEELFQCLRVRKDSLRSENSFVFHNKKGNPLKEQTVTQKFKKYIRLVGLDEKLHFHSLRHSFASGLVTSNVSLYAVQKLLGHSTSKTTEIYSHLLPQQLHREVNVLGVFFNLNIANTS